MFFILLRLGCATVIGWRRTKIFPTQLLDEPQPIHLMEPGLRTLNKWWFLFSC